MIINQRLMYIKKVLLLTWFARRSTHRPNIKSSIVLVVCISIDLLESSSCQKVKSVIPNIGCLYCPHNINIMRNTNIHPFLLVKQMNLWKKWKIYILDTFFYIHLWLQHKKEGDDVQLRKVQWSIFWLDIYDSPKISID